MSSIELATCEAARLVRCLAMPGWRADEVRSYMGLIANDLLATWTDTADERTVRLGRLGASQEASCK